MLVIIILIMSSCMVTSLTATKRLDIKIKDAQQTLEWLNQENKSQSISRIAMLPANQLMEQLLLQNEKEAETFATILSKFLQGDSLPEIDYLINDACSQKEEITELIQHISKNDFLDEVYERAGYYFPNTWQPNSTYEVFFSVTGWKWGDAMTFKYECKNNKYQLSQSGKSAIIFNLTLVNTTYGQSIDQKIKTLQNVMSHEVFHALFADFNKEKWKGNGNKSFADEVIILMFNEGLAHYIANGKEIAEIYNQSQNIKDKEKKAFETLRDKAKVIFSDDEDITKKRELALQGTYGQFWDKYLCIPALFMAYHIEKYQGREGIELCLKNGFHFFIKVYHELSEREEEIPKLPEEIIQWKDLHESKKD